MIVEAAERSALEDRRCLRCPARRRMSSGGIRWAYRSTSSTAENHLSGSAIKALLIASPQGLPSPTPNIFSAAGCTTPRRTPTAPNRAEGCSPRLRRCARQHADARPRPPGRLRHVEYARLISEIDTDTDVRRLRSGVRDLFGADLSGADLSGMDLDDVDLSHANLSGANLSGTKLRDAYLCGANFTGAKLREADLSGADLTEADFTDADLTDADLSHADLTQAKLAGTKLAGTNFDGATLTGARHDPPPPTPQISGGAPRRPKTGKILKPKAAAGNVVPLAPASPKGAASGGWLCNAPIRRGDGTIRKSCENPVPAKGDRCRHHPAT